MTDAKHTPGPWFYHEPVNRNRRDFGVVAGKPYDASVGANRRIAWVGNASNPAQSPERMEEIRANARLIAAAPDLLAVTRAFHRECITQGINFGPLIADAEAALSKAEPSHD